MAHIDVVTAVDSRLRANFTSATIYEEGQTGVPDDLSSFIALQFPYNGSEQATAGNPGNNRWREEGAFRIVINVPRDPSFIAQGRQWANEIAAIFRGQTFAGVRCWAPTSPVLDNRNDADAYYRLSLSCPYSFDIFA